MLKPSKIALMAACAALLLPYAANAATVVQQAGSVLVNKGEGYAPIAADAQVAPGTHVLVQPGGLAKITYSDTCAVRVGSGVWTVQSTAPCVPGTSEIDFTARMNQAGPDGPGGINLLAVLGGVLIVGGVITFIVWNNNKDKDKPASN